MYSNILQVFQSNKAFFRPLYQAVAVIRMFVKWDLFTSYLMATYSSRFNSHYIYLLASIEVEANHIDWYGIRVSFCLLYRARTWCKKVEQLL